MQAQPPPDAVIATPVGRVGIQLRDGALCRLDFVGSRARLREPCSAAARRVVAQLLTYFDDPASTLDPPLRLSGTDFQQRVWQALRRIPPGSVLTYGMLAERLGSSPRAVGNACRANPVPIVVPCHRVVARNGPGGFAGCTSGPMMSVKARLLRHEGVEFDALRPHR